MYPISVVGKRLKSCMPTHLLGCRPLLPPPRVAGRKAFPLGSRNRRNSTNDVAGWERNEWSVYAEIDHQPRGTPRSFGANLSRERLFQGNCAADLRYCRCPRVIQYRGCLSLFLITALMYTDIMSLAELHVNIKSKDSCNRQVCRHNGAHIVASFGLPKGENLSAIYCD